MLHGRTLQRGAVEEEEDRTGAQESVPNSLYPQHHRHQLQPPTAHQITTMVHFETLLKSRPGSCAGMVPKGPRWNALYSGYIAIDNRNFDVSPNPRVPKEASYSKAYGMI